MMLWRALLHIFGWHLVTAVFCLILANCLLVLVVGVTLWNSTQVCSGHIELGG